MGARGKHIVIVDDDPDAIDIRGIHLRAPGYDVSTAADGAGAIAQAEQWLQDLIVLDLELPGIPGFEAARRLRRNPATHDIPVIAASCAIGRSRKRSRGESGRHGAVRLRVVNASRFGGSCQPSHSSMQSAQDIG